MIPNDVYFYSLYSSIMRPSLKGSTMIELSHVGNIGEWFSHSCKLPIYDSYNPILRWMKYNITDCKITMT